MKKIFIIISGIAVSIGICYMVLFSGEKANTTKALQQSYDPYFNSLTLPICKYKNGFFNKTFYAQASTIKDTVDLTFRIDYLKETVTFEHIEDWNTYIESLHIKIAKPLARNYRYLNYGEMNYFYDIDHESVVFRLTQEHTSERKMVLDIPSGVVKVSL